MRLSRNGYNWCKTEGLPAGAVRWGRLPQTKKERVRIARWGLSFAAFFEVAEKLPHDGTMRPRRDIGRQDVMVDGAWLSFDGDAQDGDGASGLPAGASPSQHFLRWLNNGHMMAR